MHVDSVCLLAHGSVVLTTPVNSNEEHMTHRVLLSGFCHLKCSVFFQVYSLGVTMWELFNNGDSPPRQTLLSNTSSFVFKGGIPQEVSALVLHMCQYKRSDRMTIKRIVHYLKDSHKNGFNTELRTNEIRDDNFEDDSDGYSSDFDLRPSAGPQLRALLEWCRNHPVFRRGNVIEIPSHIEIYNGTSRVAVVSKAKVYPPHFCGNQSPLEKIQSVALEPKSKEDFPVLLDANIKEIVVTLTFKLGGTKLTVRFNQLRTTRLSQKFDFIKDKVCDVLKRKGLNRETSNSIYDKLRAYNQNVLHEKHLVIPVQIGNITSAIGVAIEKFNLPPDASREQAMEVADFLVTESRLGHWGDTIHESSAEVEGIVYQAKVRFMYDAVKVLIEISESKPPS